MGNDVKLITAREQIRTVAQRWKLQYWAFHSALQKLEIEILQALESLDVEAATKEDVAAIIGNTSWIISECDECGGLFDALVEFSDVYVGEYAPPRICAGCLRKALALIEGGNE